MAKNNDKREFISGLLKLMIMKFDKKVKICKLILEDIVQRTGYYGAALVQNAKILPQTLVGKSRLDFEEVVQEANSLMNNEESRKSQKKEITISYDDSKVYLQRFNGNGSDEAFWIIVNMDVGQLYYKRFINNTMKPMRSVLFS